MTHRHDAFSGVRSVNPGDCPNDPILQLSERFSTWDRAPILCAFNFEEGRISLSDLLAEDPALPLPQVYLSEIGFDDRCVIDMAK